MKRSAKRARCIPKLGSFAALALGVCLALLAPAAVAMEIHTFSTTFGAASSTPANPYPLGNPSAVAINDSGGPSNHDVYVNDPTNHRVEKFDSAGHLILMFGKEVDETKVEAHAPEAEQNICTAASGDVCQAGAPGAGPGAFEAPAFLAVDSSAGPSRGDVYVGDEGSAASEVQTVTVGATEGTFALAFEGQTTSAIAHNAPATGPNSVQQALEKLSTIGEVDVSVSGNVGGPYSVHFQTTFVNTNVPQLTCDASKLTGGSGTCSVATETQGFNTARAVKFTESGALVESWGSQGRLAVGETHILQSLYGIAVDSSGSLDFFVQGPNGEGGTGGHGLVFRFAPDGTQLSGTPELGNGGPFAVDSAGNFFNGSIVG